METQQDAYANTNYISERNGDQQKQTYGLLLNDSVDEGMCVDDDYEQTVYKTTKNLALGIARNKCYKLTAVFVVLLFVLLLTAVTVLWIKLITERNLRKQHQDAIDVQDKQTWTTFGSSLYYFSEKKNWTESRQYCRERGADLVIINSKEKQDFLVEQLQGSRVWIGLHDTGIEGIWKWVDGTILTTGYWAPGQPDDFRDEDCAEIGYPTKWQWNDRPCFQKQGWICEKSLSKTAKQ